MTRKQAQFFARIKFFVDSDSRFFFFFEAKELKELFWLSALLAFASKSIGIFWLENDTKPQGSVWDKSNEVAMGRDAMWPAVRGTPWLQHVAIMVRAKSN